MKKDFSSFATIGKLLVQLGWLLVAISIIIYIIQILQNGSEYALVYTISAIYMICASLAICGLGAIVSLLVHMADILEGDGKKLIERLLKYLLDK